MNERFARWLILLDIDWWSWFLAATLICGLPLSVYTKGFWPLAGMGCFALLSTLALARPAFFTRRFCIPPLMLLSGERVLLRVAANLQEFPSEPFCRRLFPAITGGWLYITTTRLVFHSRRRTVSVPFFNVRSIQAEPRGGWWWGIYVNARRIHVQASDRILTIGVRYPRLLQLALKRLSPNSG